MSDWLSIIIVILIIGIVLDGIRRARKSRKNEIKLSKNARKVDRLFEKEQQASYSSELPSGGARVKENTSTTTTKEQTQPVQETLDLNEPVPMLMDSVQDQQIPEQDAETSPLYDADAAEPTIGDLDDIDTIQEAPSSPLKTEKRKPAKEKKPSLFETLSETIQSANTHDDVDEALEETEKDNTPQEILIVNVIARQGARISGERLLEVFSDEKLKYGQMGIFHRHLDNDGDADVVYSVANIIEPGSFDLADINNSETPGVCVFLTLPCADNSINAYDDMIATTTRIANALDCELSDENRSILTKQAIEHGRQRVVEFERKTRLKN